MADYDIDACELSASKHFKNRYMQKWDWDYTDLRDAMRNAHKVLKVGKNKFEAFTGGKKDGKKIIFVYYKEFNSIFVISGTEG